MLDMVPDIVNKFTDKADPSAPGVENDEAIDIAFDGDTSGTDIQ